MAKVECIKISLSTSDKMASCLTIKCETRNETAVKRRVSASSSNPPPFCQPYRKTAAI